jgi:lipoprotein-releasing system permease protein
MFEFFIAKRYLKSKHKINFISIISILSTLGITIGVAALIIVLSVFNGFGGIVKDILISFDPHVRVTLKSFEANTQVDSTANFLNSINGIKTAQTFVDGKSILLKNKSYKIVNIKGIEETTVEEDWGVRTSMFAGEYNLSDSSNSNDAIIGLSVALDLSAKVGDTLSVTSFNNIEQVAVNFAMPKTFKLVVTGIYRTGKDYEGNLIFTSLKTAQKVLGLKNQITGFELRLNDIDEAEHVKEIISENLNEELFTIDTWYDLHKDLYGVMLIERWAAYIILCLIIAVATFNILGSLTMSVIEKRKDIGVLKSIGVSDKSVLRIFMFEGILIGLIGTIAGVIIGLAVCILQIEYGFYSLGAKFIIDALPVKIVWTDLVVISGMSMLLAFLASLYPAKKAAKQQVVEAIKWE